MSLAHVKGLSVSKFYAVVKIVVLGLLAPEFIILWAMRQWFFFVFFFAK
jgi:hypothetical protein